MVRNKYIILVFVFVTINLNSATNFRTDSKFILCDMDTEKKINIEEFLYINASIESKHVPNVANKNGCFGLYQMNKYSLTEIGFSEKKLNKMFRSIRYNDDKKIYLFDTTHFGVTEQRKRIEEYLFLVETHYLRKSINTFVGRKRGGVRITKAGILSASFLGYLNVAKYLASNGKINYRDGNGQTIKDRLMVFSNKEVEKEFLYSLF
jgi:hypothetical protein